MSRRGSFATAIAHSGVMFGNSKGQNFLFDVTRARFINNVPFKRCPILPYQVKIISVCDVDHVVEYGHMWNGAVSSRFKNMISSIYLC